MANKSIAFDNMKNALFAAMRKIPKGHVIEFSEIGNSLNIPARHVAFIITSMKADEKEVLPWHRLVPKDGKFGLPKKRTEQRRAQIALLLAEGVTIDTKGYISDLPSVSHQPDDRHRNTLWADIEPD